MKKVAVMIVFSVTISQLLVCQNESNSKANKKVEAKTKVTEKKETEKKPLPTIPELLGETLNEALAPEYKKIVADPNLTVSERLEKIEQLKERSDLQVGDSNFLTFLENTLSNKRFFPDKEEKKTMVMLQAPLEKALSLLHWAIENGQDINSIKKLLAYDLIDKNIQDEKGNTPTHKAAGNGYLEIIDILCRAGAEVDSRDYIEGTPLHNAAYAGHEEAVEILIGKGAQVNLTTNTGATPLHYAIRQGKRAVVKKLLKHGAAVDVFDEENMTPLHEAAKLGNAEIVKMLLQKNPDIYRKNYDNKTAKKVAEENNHSEIVELLEEAELYNGND